MLSRPSHSIAAMVSSAVRGPIASRAAASSEPVISIVPGIYHMAGAVHHSLMVIQVKGVVIIEAPGTESRGRRRRPACLLPVQGVWVRQLGIPTIQVVGGSRFQMRRRKSDDVPTSSDHGESWRTGGGGNPQPTS